MRMIAILALLVAAIAMGQPRPAEAAGSAAAADCHGMPASTQEHDKGHPQSQLAHSCPGCALPLGHALCARVPLALPLVLNPSSSHAMTSLASAPIPPPPRKA